MKTVDATERKRQLQQPATGTSIVHTEDRAKARMEVRFNPQMGNDVTAATEPAVLSRVDHF